MANAIMVLDHGKIIERGTHEELLENSMPTVLRLFGI